MDGYIDRVVLAEDRENWWVVVCTVKNLGFYNVCGIVEELRNC